MTASSRRDRIAAIARRIGAVVGAIELTVGGIALLTILVLVFHQALQRYLPIDQIAWTGEVSRFSLMWLTFIVAGLLVSTRGHIALEIADAIPHPMVVRGVQVFAMLVVAATGAGLMHEAWTLVATQGIIKSPVLRLPMSWVYVPVLLGSISITVRAAVAAVQVALFGPVLRETADGPVTPVAEDGEATA
ncbi:TRAP transporter small permease [Demequina mangrovi]|uniref:TRAP-type C4-dicarboxylate transport system, small permease component n=1 Tax=Demequina mangrovi TaxID=1043493 RepID=A0A1H6Z739_9MICO|nr:TRAP transporter small permease subunit [Demequina mangrovi]SEJ47804.1 TRAP-type C4-dicarboxylate transport system, small permease component [Demequina mangrovi]